MSLKDRVNDDMKAAMRARETERLATIRLLLAAIKQREVDERITLDDAAVIAVIDKMIKQRKDSITQFDAAGRRDLADQERAEVAVLTVYLPEPLSDAVIVAQVQAAVEQVGAAGPGDMGKVMSLLREKLTGRVDMAVVSARVKAALTK